MAGKSPLTVHKLKKEELNEKLVAAILGNKVSMVRKFLSSGADPNFCTSGGDTMLTIATKCPEEIRLAIMGELLSKGANINAYSSSRHTPLLLAARMGDSELVSFLVENHACLTLDDSEGNSPLSLAALEGHTALVRYLIEEFKQAGLSVDKKNMLGLTPLLLAAQNGFVAACKLLVCQGNASTTVRDLDNFMTAEDWLRTSTVVPDSELDFIARRSVRRKKAQGMPKKAKLLSDYIDRAAPSPSAHNVYTYRHCEPVQDDGLKSVSLPAILSDDSSTTPPANSMFDVPKKDRSFGVKPRSSLLDSFHELPLKGGKAKVFDSPFLAKRRVAPTKYIPNKQAQGMCSGSLKPLAIESTVPSNKKQSSTMKAATTSNLQVSKKPALPPIKRT